MRSLVVRMVPVDRHSVNDPTVDQNLNGDDSYYQNQLPPVKEFSVRKLPVKRDHRNSKTVSGNAQNGEESSEPDQTSTSVSNAIGEQETGHQDETEYLDQKPVAPGGIQKIPVVSVSYANPLQAEVG